MWHIFWTYEDRICKLLLKLLLFINLGSRGAESPGRFNVWPKNSAWDMVHEQARCRDEAANHELPITAAFESCDISTEEHSSLTQNLMQICCSIHSVILNTMATQYTCSLNGIYCPHWLVQWSRHCSRMCIPVHSPWLPGYINVAQTILVILTMAGLFLGRPRTQKSNWNSFTFILNVLFCFFTKTFAYMY